jgi:serine/threonine-protein kinase ATR
VRSFLILPRLGVDRAHLYFFNDSDEPKLHASSGITRNFKPKPVFHSLAWLQRSLGDFRFSRVDRESPPGECFCYEFTHANQPGKRVLAAWLPTGDSRKVRLFIDTARVVRTELMPLTEQQAPHVPFEMEIEGYLAIECGERPVFIWLE